MGDFPVSRPRVYIAAMGRSGSTMLANLLHNPPGCVALVEPNLLSDAPTAECLRQAAESGQQDGEPWSAVLDRARAWGLKEVRADLHEPTIRLLRPQHILVLLRDPLAAAVSLYEKGIADGDLHRLAWLEARAREPLRVLPAVAVDPRAVVVAYERFVTDDSSRDALARYIDWPLTGDPNRGLARWNRAREIGLHGGAVTAKRAGPLEPGVSSEAVGFAHRVTAGCDAVTELHRRAMESSSGLAGPAALARALARPA